MSDRHLTDITEQIGDPVSEEERLRLYDRYAWARDLTRGQDVIEVACGTGQGVAMLRRTVRSIVGTDLSESNIAAAKRAFGEDLPVRRDAATPLAEADNSLDAVLILEALYFLPDADAFLREARRVLRPGGKLLVTTNNRDSANFSPNWMGRTYFGVPDLAEALARAGFNVSLQGGCRIEDKAQSGGPLLALKTIVQKLGLTPKNKRLRQIIKQVMYGRTAPLDRDIPADATHPTIEPLDPSKRYREFKILYAVATKPT